MQPGLMQPGLAEPGPAQPGLRHPRLMQPGLTQPGLMALMSEPDLMKQQRAFSAGDVASSPGPHLPQALDLLRALHLLQQMRLIQPRLLRFPRNPSGLTENLKGGILLGGQAY